VIVSTLQDRMMRYVIVLFLIEKFGIPLGNIKIIFSALSEY